ncbi:MAG TPA: patatin-like phospholipase family protein [Blastocatellia bacterium]|nr:patatin-like phospholipase family protein [Blastocatellia bacterium]
MKDRLHKIRSSRIGLALSGGSVRGLAHIGVIKALAESGIRPSVIAGTSAGSLIGAAVAAGLDWPGLADMARSVFWPSLLNGERLERFCAEHLPETFKELRLPFAAVATSIPSKQPVSITQGRLATAISASCALRLIRRPVLREGERLKDGGIACVLPAQACRDLGAEFVIGSDVWEVSSLLRSVGLSPARPGSERFYPSHYRQALGHTDLLIHPKIPRVGYLPGAKAIEHMIAAGQKAAHRALSFSNYNDAG